VKAWLRVSRFWFVVFRSQLDNQQIKKPTRNQQLETRNPKADIAGGPSQAPQSKRAIESSDDRLATSAACSL